MIQPVLFPQDMIFPRQQVTLPQWSNLNSVGYIPSEISGVIKSASKFLMVATLAAIGQGTSITDFKKAGFAPMLYGITIDTLVTLTALVVIWCMGLM